MPYDVDAIRQKLKQSMAGKYSDPDEFRPEKAKSTTDAIKYRFFVLPPLQPGDKVKGSQVKKPMEQFYIAHANHWVNDRPHPCPRVWDGSDCEICQFGFDLLRDEKDDDKRRNIIKQWMPSTYYMVNVFFPVHKNNPEDLHNKVRFYNAPKTCFDQWTAALMRDDCGDADDPEAFGVFFDERAAFPFELQVLKHGRQNSYKTSKFIVAKGGAAVPIMANKDGSPHERALEAILGARLNLWDKIEIPDPAKITKLAQAMINGDPDAAAGENKGFDEDEAAAAAAAAPPTKAQPAAKSALAKTETKPAKPAAKAAKAEAPDDEDVMSHLEAQLAGGDTKPAQTKKPAPAAAPTSTNGKEALAGEGPAAPVASGVGEDTTDQNTNSEIDALLSQLDDN